MKKQGFANVYDALRALPVAQGAVQDNQNTNSFTPGATTISLLGLSPSYTLVLMNGKPLADYPLLYNSQSNFVDLSSIPNSIVDHIDVLPGNNSAIYGSAAIAGVINIVTKQKIDGIDLNYRLGGYTDGGGQQQRLQISGGHSWGKLDIVWAVQLDNQDPIYGYQRSYTNSNLDAPVASQQAASRVRLISDALTGKYIDPGAAACTPALGLFNNSVAYDFRKGRGYYCGSYIVNAYSTFLNQNKSASGYVTARYQLNDSLQLYGDFTGSTSKQTYATGGLEYWGLNQSNLLIYDLDSNHYLGGVLGAAQHIFAPEEIGTIADPSQWSESYVFTLGARGAWGNFNYDASFHRSDAFSGSKQLHPLTDKVNAFFLGPQAGTDPGGYGYPAYHLSSNPKFWGAITQQDYRSFSDYIRSDSRTYTEVANLTVNNTDLFALPAGSVGFGGVLEWGQQYWNNPVDPRITAGAFTGVGGTSGRGTRDRWAGAFEFSVPIFSMLTADLSGRYDKYSTDASSQGKFTYKAGFEFRPIDTLLIRGNYGTAFRAPDMGYVFSGGSKAFLSGQTDYYNCAKGQPTTITTCTNNQYTDQQIQTNSVGNQDLKYITAKSFGYGLVWSPTSNLTLKADYVHVRISNEVNQYSADSILRTEADCRLGTNFSGTHPDPNSALCKTYNSWVVRVPLNSPASPGGLLGVIQLPVNTSVESVSNIIAEGSYRWETGHWGDLIFSARYNVQTSHLYQDFPGDPFQDYLRTNAYGNQFKQSGLAGVTWNIGSWSTSVQYLRYGKTFSYDGSFTVGPWMKYNATVQYNFSDDASLTLIGNNIFNARPPYDRSFAAYPYYDLYSYNSYGRLVMLEMNVHFGGSKK